MRIEIEEKCILLKSTHHAKKIITIKTRDGREFHKLGDKPELQNAKSQLDSILMPHRPERALTGAIRLRVDVTWPWLASDPKRVRDVKTRIPHTTKPDWDNLGKGIADALVRWAFIAHDGMIYDGRVCKWRGDEPGLRIVLEEIIP